MKYFYPAFLIFFFSFIAGKLSGNTIYVNQNASGISNGTTWQNAFQDLQDTLSIAQNGDSIWVAEATYYPTEDNDRYQSFIVPNGVVLLGGFAGMEISVLERAWENHPTVLSGNIGNLSDSTDNSFHVLQMIDADITTIIDGFIIRNGFAKGTTGNETKGGGLLITGATANFNYNPIIRNCLFEHNVATTGGAIYCNANAGIKLLETVFKYNYASSKGGSLSKVGGNDLFDAYYIENCSFERNKALDSGGAIYHEDPQGNAIIKNSTFERDSCMGEGGAIYYYAISGTAVLEIENSLFSHNKAGHGGALSLILDSGWSPDEFYHFKIVSCDFKFNKAVATVGGGIAISTYGTKSKLDLLQTVFETNSGSNGGGGLEFYNNTDSESEIIIKECQFYHNYCPFINAAGAIYYRTTSFNIKANIKIINSLFYGNRGGVALISGTSNQLKSEIVNCTFVNNGEYIIDKNWSPDFNGLDTYNTLTISNSIFWEYTPINKMFYNNDPSNYTIHDYFIDHSIVNAPNCIVEGVDACGDGVLYENYPMFKDTVAGDLSIALCSPAVNAGNNIPIDTSGVENDIIGGARKVGGAVDIGAYEQQYESIMALTTVENVSQSGATDGSILIDSFIGGNPPYTVLWENGETSYNLDNLAAGDYLLTITDADGCSFPDTITVDIINGLFILDPELFLIYPNPATDMLHLRLPENHTFSPL